MDHNGTAGNGEQEPGSPEPWERAEAFRSFVDRNDDLMLVVDPRAHVVYANRAVERILGLAREECLGRSLFDSVYPEDDARTRTAFEKWSAERDASSFTFQNRQVSWDGAVRHMLWTVTPCRDEQSELRCLALCGRDVGPLWRLEDDQARRAARQGALLAGMLDPVVTIDQRGTILSASDSIATLFGYAPAELVGGNVARLMPEPHKGAHDGYLARYRATGETNILNRTRRFEVQHRDGRILVCELSVSRVDVPGDHEPIFIGSFRDVTTRSRAEALLQESERRFRAIFEQEFQLVGLLDLEGKVLEINRAALEASGLAREEVVGKPFWETRWWSPDSGRLRAAVARAAGGEFVRFETGIRRPSGETLAVDFSLKPIRDEHGRVVLLLPEGRDITELREAERRETSMLRALAAIGESASLLAHEIKNPITALNFALKAVADRLGEEHREVVDDLAHRLQRLERTMRRTLSFARPLDLHRRPCAPRALLEDAAAALAPEFARAGLTLEVACAPGLPELDVDPELVAEALENLLRNALEALAAQGRGAERHGERVRLEAARGARGVTLSVEDDGPGVSPTIAAGLFRPFVTSKEQGTGLGLALCRRIAEEHGGKIEAARSALGGARFTLWLPEAAAEPAGVRRPS